jgi:hypothetical protein
MSTSRTSARARRSIPGSAVENELLLPQGDALVLMRALTLQAVSFQCWPVPEPSEEPLVFVRVARADAWRVRGFEDRRTQPRPSAERRTRNRS